MSASDDIAAMSTIGDIRANVHTMVLRSPRDIGAFARDRRKQLALDQASIAARVGVSRQWLIDFEKGKPRAEIGLVLRTLAALGIVLVGKETAEAPSDVEDLDAIVERAREPRPRARPRAAKTKRPAKRRGR